MALGNPNTQLGLPFPKAGGGGRVVILLPLAIETGDTCMCWPFGLHADIYATMAIVKSCLFALTW